MGRSKKSVTGEKGKVVGNSSRRYIMQMRESEGLRYEDRLVGVEAVQTKRRLIAG